MEYIPAALIVSAAIAVATMVVLRAIRSANRRGTADPALSLLQNQVATSLQQTDAQVRSLRESLSQTVQTMSGQMTKSLTDTNKAVGDRLDNTTRVMGDVREQLGKLEQSSERMIEMGRDIAKLEQILQPPKLRGALGELFLADLLAQILPAGHYQLQYRFKGGEAVDAVIMLRSGMVPIDAKFPLDNFRRILSADSEEKRKNAKRVFIKDVKGHITAIASKYIRTDENTFDFALMYVPAENVYYETLIRDDAFGGEMSLFNFALQKRVIPVSPNSFYAYLQTIILGLKGMRVEERSREILDSLSRLQKEFENFAEAFRLVGQHLDNSTKKYMEAQKRFGKVELKVEQIDGLTRGLELEDGEQTAPRRLEDGEDGGEAAES